MRFISEQVAGRVTNLRVANANSRKIRIAWIGAPGATGYRVTWRQGNSKCLMLPCVCEFIIFSHILLY